MGPAGGLAGFPIRCLPCLGIRSGAFGGAFWGLALYIGPMRRFANAAVGEWGGAWRDNCWFSGPAGKGGWGEKLLFLGPGGHGRAIRELLRDLGGFDVAGFVDAAPPAGPVLGLAV